VVVLSLQGGTGVPPTLRGLKPAVFYSNRFPGKVFAGKDWVRARYRSGGPCRLVAQNPWGPARCSPERVRPVAQPRIRAWRCRYARARLPGRYNPSKRYG